MGQLAYWATNTAHSSPGQYIAVLHDNGNFAIYSGSDPYQVSENTRLWQSNTAIDPHALTITVVAGNNQNLKVTKGTDTTILPLVVLVQQQNGQPAPHVPVSFGLAGTGGPTDVMFTPGPPGSQTEGPVTLSTDSNGIASLEQARVICFDGAGIPSCLIDATIAGVDPVYFHINITLW